MNGLEQLIGGALREIAADAPPPRPMSGSAWRAGRRRRVRVLAASAAAGAGTIAAAVVLTLAAIGSPARTVTPERPAAPVSLRMPIEFRQVASISGASCPPGSPGVPGEPGFIGGPPAACFQLTHAGMTVTELRSARITRSPGSSRYILDIRLTTADAGRFAALTRKLAGLRSPRDQMAIIVGGRVVADPAVMGPMTTGQAQISGFTSRAQAENLLPTG